MAAARSPVLASCALLAYSTTAIPQELTVGDLKDPQKITGDELRQVLTGAKIASKTRHGSTRHWTNHAGGKFTASTDSRGLQGAPTAYQTTGAGSWHVSANDPSSRAVDFGLQK